MRIVVNEERCAEETQNDPRQVMIKLTFNEAIHFQNWLYDSNEQDADAGRLIARFMRHELKEALKRVRKVNEET